MSENRLAVCVIVHDDDGYLAPALASFAGAGDPFVFVSRLPWHDQPGDWQAAAHTAEATGATVVLGDWTSELSHRQAAREWLLEKGYTHALIPDGDEIASPELLSLLAKIADCGSKTSHVEPGERHDDDSGPGCSKARLRDRWAAGRPLARAGRTGDV